MVYSDCAGECFEYVCASGMEPSWNVLVESAEAVVDCSASGAEVSDADC